jgi:hypothetical protein
VSPLRAAYVFCGRGADEVLTFTPEVLAAETSAGRAALVTEPVPLFERAVSVTLEYLAEQKRNQKPDAASEPRGGAGGTSGELQAPPSSSSQMAPSHAAG